MLICRVPLRISLFGGGTDFPSWYKKNNGATLCFAINKYCYTIIRKLSLIVQFKYRLRYFKNEIVFNINDIKHRSIKAVLKNYDKSRNNYEIVHSADLPALSGLGSSSAFTVSLIKCISEYNGVKLSKLELAKRAIHVEQNILKENVGSQDQILSRSGWFNLLNLIENKKLFGFDSDNTIFEFFLKANCDIFSNESTRSKYHDLFFHLIGILYLFKFLKQVKASDANM